ncbi:MAG: hypothetical protein JWN95_3742 [Frankiales bacterium]|nr:hypothetical protein [Frankiales bacterium]
MSHQIVLAAAAKTPFIDWSALGQVALVSFVFGVAIVVLYSVGILGMSWARGHDEGGEGPASLAALDAGAQSGSVAANRPLGATLAGICFLICAGAVVYGLYLIIPQFH